jgi:mono/diheme cytochrome c family protein
MKTLVSAVIGVAVALSLSGVAAAAQKAEKSDMGKREWQANCAACHGMDGKGVGPITDLLKKSPGDLTTLAKKNNGVFPVARVYEVIDGTKDVKAHGTRDMPIWGQEYSIRAAEYYQDIPYDPEVYVRARILSLIDYLYRLQVK